MNDIRVGTGYDVHRFSKDRKLFIGCVEIEYEYGLTGHSDADVLCHAVADSMLGAIGERDIGFHFPDSSDEFEGISGEKILSLTLGICREKGYSVSNIDCTVIAQKPKLSPYIPEMQRRMANVLCVPPDRVNVKATTEEGLGFTGKLEGISAQAVTLMKK